VEGLLRLAMSTETLPRLLYGRGDQADRLAIEALTARGTEAFLARRLPVPLIWEAELGWRVRPDLDQRDQAVSGEDVLTTTTAEGFRLTKRAPGGTTVLVLGDSFAFGTEVSDHEVWTEAVALQRPDLDLINAAVPGYGHDQMWMRLRQLGPELDPALVVIPWIDADLVRNVRDVFVWAKPRFEPQEGRLVQVVSPPTPDALVWAYRTRSRTWDVLKVSWSLAVPPPAPDPHPISVALGHALADEAARLQALLVLVRAPVPWQLDEGRVRYESSLEARTFASVCDHPQVRCADAGPAFFDLHDQGHRLRRDAHWDPEGQALLGRAVVGALAGLP
jgi:hypothetical protein